MNTSEVLDKAADLLEEKGWQRGFGWWDQGHGLCVEGAIAAAIDFKPNPGTESRSTAISRAVNACPAGVAVHDYLTVRGEMPDPEGPLWKWNDDHGDRQSVIAALRGAAAAERDKENQ